MADTPHINQTHPAIVKRLRRAGGHLSGIVEMIKAGRPCIDIAQQLQAVEKAIAQAKKTLIHDHLDHCVAAAVGPVPREQQRSIDDLREIAKYL